MTMSRSGRLQLYVVNIFITDVFLTGTKLRGPEFATVEKPPNIAQFDAISTRTVVSKSPLLQARLNNMAK